MTTSNRYYETFENTEEVGWAFLTSDANISVNNGLLNVNTTSDDLIQMILPIGATKMIFLLRLTEVKPKALEAVVLVEWDLIPLFLYLWMMAQYQLYIQMIFNHLLNQTM